MVERSMTHAELCAFLERHDLAVLATLSAAGTPQSALIGIAVTSTLEMVFDTLSTSRKYANLVANPLCSLVIGWTGEITVQYEGRAHEISGEAARPYMDVYFRTWPDGRARQSWPGIAYFVVRPTWIRYSDFNRVPPEIHERLF